MATVLSTVDPSEKAPDSGSSGTSELTPLLCAAREAGLLRRRRGHYVMSIAVNLLALAAVWAAVVLVGGTGPWRVQALAVPAAVLSARGGFVGHEPGTSR